MGRCFLSKKPEGDEGQSYVDFWWLGGLRGDLQANGTTLAKSPRQASARPVQGISKRLGVQLAQKWRGKVGGKVREEESCWSILGAGFYSKGTEDWGQHREVK